MTASSLDAELKNLLLAIALGDQQAFAAFYDLTSAKVFGLARFMLGDEGLAEEVTEDVYWQVWQEAGRYRAEKAAPLTWLLMIAKSRGIDRLRAVERAETCDIEELAGELADAGAGPEALALDAERSRRVRACLALLPAVERQKLALAFFRGLSQSEMAGHCRMPLGTVKTHVRNGMARLGELLRQQAGPDPHENL